jgi:hypothetical protein
MAEVQSARGQHPQRSGTCPPTPARTVTVKSATWVLLLCASLFATSPLTAETLAYPGPDNASFLIDHPADWEVEPGEEVGDYVTLTGPTGAVVQLRTMPGDEEAVKQAVQDSMAFIEENFSNVKMGEQRSFEHLGMKTWMVGGKGDDADGEAVVFLMYLFALPDGNIADIWYSVQVADKEGMDEATQVLGSFRAP